MAMRIRMRRPSRRRRPTGTFQRLGLTRAQLQKQKQRPTATSAGPTAAQKAKLVAALKAAKAKAKPTGTPRPNVTIRDPKIKSKPTGTPRPKRTISQAMKDASNVLTETPAPKPRLKRKPTGTPRPTRGIRGATQAQLRQIRQRQNPTGTPQKLKPGATAPQRLPFKPPTSAQKAAMRKQATAKYGNAAQRRRTQDAAARRLLRQGKISPGQVRSMKIARQTPRRRPTGAPKKRRII